MSQFLLPDLGEGLTEAEIVAWHVGPNDDVVADQPLVSVETQKAVVEIPSPRAGTIAQLLAAVGDVVPVGAPLVEFADGRPEPAAALVGRLADAPGAPLAPATAAPSREPVPKAMPAVRRLAQERGIDLAAVRPSGAHGEITREDVLALAAGAADWELLHGPRRIMAEVMARAGASVVPATLMDETDVTGWPSDAPVTFRLVQALVAACKVEPALNAWYDPDGSRRLLHQALNLGIAVDTPDGLLVPVLRDAGRLAPDALHGALERIVDQARSRTAAPELFRDPTLTLSNFGSLGGRHATLVVVPPQVAILGAGRTFQRGEGRILPLSLTFDHRAVTGGEAARFIAATIAALQSGLPDAAPEQEAS